MADVVGGKQIQHLSGTSFRRCSAKKRRHRSLRNEMTAQRRRTQRRKVRMALALHPPSVTHPDPNASTKMWIHSAAS